MNLFDGKTFTTAAFFSRIRIVELKRPVQPVSNEVNFRGVILDPVGGDAFDQSMRCINWGGRLLVVGFASGRIPELAVNRALLKGCAVIGVNWPEYVRRNPRRFQDQMAAVLGWCASGELRPRIDRTLPLEGTAEALKALMARGVSGKIVITPR